MIFRVAAFPRSGTLFTSQLLRSFGYDIGHDRPGEDGRCHWLCALHTHISNETVLDKAQRLFKSAGHISPKRDASRFFVHLIRDPLKVIPSAHECEPYIGKIRHWLNINGDSLHDTANAWLMWNAIIQAQRPDCYIRVEEAEERFTLLLRQNNMKINAATRPPVVGVHRGQHSTITDTDLLQHIRLVRSIYGYET